MSYERARKQARRAYERSRVRAAVRGLAGGVALSLLAMALTGRVSGLVGGVLAVSVAVFAWRGGAWQRGSILGALAAIPAVIILAVASALPSYSRCATCPVSTSRSYVIVCFAVGAASALLVAKRALVDTSPRSFAIAAAATTGMTGLLGSITFGMGGAVGVAIGVAGGCVAGWIAGRAGA